MVQSNDKYSDDGFACPEPSSPPPPLPPDTPDSPPVFFGYNESDAPSSATYQERGSTQWQSSVGDSFDEENSFEATIV